MIYKIYKIKKHNMINTIQVEYTYDKKLTLTENQNNSLKIYCYDNKYPIIFGVSSFFNDKGKYILELKVGDSKYHTYGFENHKIMMTK